ncbi:pseudouridine synthase [Aureispira sp. CCB-E]|uniref:RluA family pseudouridine synthase n=1 Tax=Aureispira sp. CCB-E TaxID=3051121 RepID=UPI0028691F20|nr:pseudouridine synthase [Aureispira sp. CCB-E]WMX13059.1 pseudouridine synthase [Aureispira sp. CCB-E]
MKQKEELGQLPNCFIPFEESMDEFVLPEKFTFPFYYEPHPISIFAAKKLQVYLETQSDWKHNFYATEGTDEMAIGKMFGVLVVKTKDNRLGYLAAFSGKLANENHHAKFVPPVFDMLREDGFFVAGVKVINAINQAIKDLETKEEYLAYQSYLKAEIELSEARLAFKRKQMKEDKKRRKATREAGRNRLSPQAFKVLEQELKDESLGQQYYYKQLVKFWKARIAMTQAEVAIYENELMALKEARKEKSAALQRQLFNQYVFLNKDKEEKSLYDIFLPTINDVPPAGAGECAAPKLLQYAFLHDMKPIALAEFWWGESPKSAIRKHGYFYPACRGKCEPILGHMLAGIPMDENPMLTNPAEGKTIDILYEDEDLLVINKPADFFSVPGITIKDSVLLRMKQRYPTATGPLTVHRLDMSTSGLMLIAKKKEIHKSLQYQFIKRTIKKRYVALLDGYVDGAGGFIDLPHRVDLDDRPRQIVCFEHGKNARTKWEVIERSNNQTRVYFYPITGRTHQLRVHAAHPLGLNVPIIGDDLYGKKGERLLLHAESIEFVHPVTKELMTMQVDPEF